MDDNAILRAGAFHIERVTVRGLTMAFLHEGAGGFPLLLIHGWPETKRIGPEDHVIYPDFDRMAAAVFTEHVGPFIVRGAGHFLQWEAAHLLNQTIRYFCGTEEEP